MSEPTTYQTSGGATVTVSSHINAFARTTHFFECNGCDGIRGFTTADVAEDEAKEHAKRCTAKAADGGVR